ncbi:MAG TPA: energy-coupling factor ABC transporter permease [Thauera sp.]|uniref:energy-coupling factor ABC transporter permease n=1 Tax=Thauera sp. TaxID=1905334 RepID=UPI002C494976|nr:energy-coupling factor ABC transporter permease [Thauera sp.]HRP26565.1 energy-coupling factor ABC transporter permease [Thauera sp.]HRP67462.1 energy-coupling factor ABC transporter permease [Thauera sp.]
MNLPASLFSATWHGFMLVVTALTLYSLLRRAPWGRLRDGRQLNLLLGFAVCLTLMWSLKAGVMPGLTLHLLGAMAATLALGPWFALAVLALALTGITLNGALEWVAWPLNFVLMAVVPVALAYGIQRAIERWLPAHFFIFVFVTSFAGAALTVMLQGAVSSLAMMLAGAYSAAFLLSEYLPFFLLLGFSEAWISGAIITLMVVYRPEWVAAFDDRRYLIDK